MNGHYVGRWDSIYAATSSIAKEAHIFHEAKIAVQVESPLMKPLSLLATVCLLASPAAGMSPACDRIDDPGQRSACHAQDDARWRWQQQDAQRPEQRPQVPAKPAVNAQRLHGPASLAADPVYLAALRVRRENCWEWAGRHSAAEGSGPNQTAGRRTDLAVSCLAQTKDIPERFAAAMTGDAAADRFRSCLDRLKASHATDEEPPLLIQMMDACVRLGTTP